MQKNKEKQKTALIIQGGGFRTGFSTGVLDAFQTYGYNEFDIYIGVSGGAIALSYFLSEQYQYCFDAICLLAKDKNFMRYSRMMSNTGVMDIDYFHEVSSTKIPLDLNKLISNSEKKNISIVLTNRTTGKPKHFQPNSKTWVDAVIASCTIPFVTKGKHLLQGVEYMDGGWSDPLPVKSAYKNGAKEIVVIRTSPPDLKADQTWYDYFGSFIFSSNKKLQNCFENSHLKYNMSIDFINSCPKDLVIKQVAPESLLKAGTYLNSVDAITTDYRYGVQAGVEFLRGLKD